MTPSRLETTGIALVIVGAVALAVAVAVLGGWPWGLLAAALQAAASGVLLIRTAALQEPVAEPEGGEGE